MAAVDAERIFQLRVNGKTIHLQGRAQVAELISLLAQTLVDAETSSASQRFQHEPVKMECIQIGSLRLTGGR